MTNGRLGRIVTEFKSEGIEAVRDCKLTSRGFRKLMENEIKRQYGVGEWLSG